MIIMVVVYLPVPTLAQREGLIKRIEDPAQYFEDQRRNWLDKTIYFLRCETIYRRNPYFDWYYNPFDMVGSKPKRDDLLFRKAVFEEVWLGQIHIVKPGEDNWILGFFWKARLLGNGNIIYFWDDGEGGTFNFGFVDDYEEAKKHEGEKLWNKSNEVLYKMNDEDVIPLKNLEPAHLVEVEWGEYGNYPIKFIMESETGEKGYLIYKTYSKFIENWYTYNPKEKFFWKLSDWKLIEQRQLRMGMSPDMVLISWGKPTKIETRQTDDGENDEVWKYEGVRETTYTVHFHKKRLQSVDWQEKEKTQNK